MTFFDTLKDKNVKALFRTLAPALYDQAGRPFDHFVADLTFEQRLHVFQVAHACMKTLGIPGWQEPVYLNIDPIDESADA